MYFINLFELIQYHPYHISTFANFADVTEDMLQEAIMGHEQLTKREVMRIAHYTRVPYSLLTCPKLIKIEKGRYRHRLMVNEFEKMLFKIYEAYKKGNKDAAIYMRYHRISLVDLILDFQNTGAVTYCRYLGIRERAEQMLLSIKNEQHKPRGLRRD